MKQETIKTFSALAISILICSCSGGANKEDKKEIEKEATTEIVTPVEKNAVTPNDSNTTSLPAPEEQAPQVVNIPKNKGVMSLNDAYNQYDNRKRMTASEREKFRINKIKHPDFDNKWNNSQLAFGKDIYSGEQGTLVSLLYIEKEHASTEFLVSYDKQGNFIDCISIGSVSAYGGDRGECVFNGNKLTARFSFIEEGGGGITSIEYEITPALKFKKIKEKFKSH